MWKHVQRTVYCVDSLLSLSYVRLSISSLLQPRPSWITATAYWLVSSISSASTHSSGAECGGPADLQPETFLSHLWSAYQPTLATSPAVYGVQDRRTDVQSFALRYLGPLSCVGDMSGQRTLYSASTNQLVKLSSRAVPVVASQIWNTMPEEVTPEEVISASTLRSFQPCTEDFFGSSGPSPASSFTATLLFRPR